MRGQYGEEKAITSLSRSNSQCGTTERQLRFAERVAASGIITGEKVSVDASIIQAWFRDCQSANNPEHRYRKCRRHRHRDRSASWTWDHHKHMYIFGFKVHVLIDCLTGLPIALKVTKGGFGESRTDRYFVDAAAKFSLRDRMAYGRSTVLLQY